MGKGKTEHDPILVKALGDVLRELRTDQRMPLEIVATRLGLSKGVVGQYERGERIPSIDRFVDLCEVYGASPQDALRVISLRVSIMRRFPTEEMRKAREAHLLQQEGATP